MTPKNYLPHLDGLRAIALTGVLLFHFKLPYFQGGFAGVDVFLSLSGFLITRNILRDVSSRSFSITEFYKRRFWRLYPASTSTTAAVLLMSVLEFPPDLALSVSKSAIASMLLSSNAYFNFHADYFDQAANTKPLLHTWSLSLEEQFYLIWPVAILLASRCYRKYAVLSTALILMFMASFACAVILSAPRPSFTFYELPSRIWQFASGAGIAVWNASNGDDHIEENSARGTDAILQSEGAFSLYDEEDSPEIAPKVAEGSTNPVLLDSFAVLGIAGLITSFGLLPREASPQLMVPTTLCTCILIALPNSQFSMRILSNSVLMAAGRLSYTAYLVHWPLYVFASHTMSGLKWGEPHPVTMVALTILLAAVLKKGIEDPVRRGRNRIKFLVLAGVTIVVACTGLLTNGFQFRMGDIDVNLTNHYQATQLRNLCKDGKENVIYRNFYSHGCRVGDQNGTRGSIVFFGDSFTLHLAGALDEMGKRRAEWYNLHYRSGCNFLPQDEAPERCRASNKRLWKELSRLPNTSVVAVANLWKIGDGMPQRIEASVSKMASEMQARGHKLMVIGEPPGLGRVESSYYTCADLAVMPLARFWSWAKRRTFVGAAHCANLKSGLRPNKHAERIKKVYESMFTKGIANAKFVDVFKAICDRAAVKGGSLCAVPTNLETVVFDIGYRRDLRHLTIKGSRWLSEVYEKGIFGSSRQGEKDALGGKSNGIVEDAGDL